MFKRKFEDDDMAMMDSHDDDQIVQLQKRHCMAQAGGAWDNHDQMNFQQQQQNQTAQQHMAFQETQAHTTAFTFGHPSSSSSSSPTSIDSTQFLDPSLARHLAHFAIDNNNNNNNNNNTANQSQENSQNEADASSSIPELDLDELREKRVEYFSRKFSLMFTHHQLDHLHLQ